MLQGHARARGRLDVWRTGPVTWAISGSVDLATVGAFREALLEIVGEGVPVTVRCQDLQFIDVTGMRTLVAIARSRPSVQIVIHKAPEAFRRYWDLLGLDVQAPTVRFVP